MGLDIFHYRASKLANEPAVAMEPVPTYNHMREECDGWFVSVDLEVIDWNSTLAARGIALADYVQGPSIGSLLRGKQSRLEYHTFCARNPASGIPTTIVFTNDEDRSLFGRRL